MATETILTAQEVADRLRVSTGSVYQAVKRGELKAIRIGTAYRIRESAYREWVERREHA